MPRWLDAGRVSSAAFDLRCALALHRGAERPRVAWLLTVCSRLGDGPMWLAIIAVLPFFGGPQGPACALNMLLLGSIDLLIYWSIKRATRRLRPYQQCPGIRARLRAADPFSFPSGHTLHAVAFALLLSANYPSLTPLLWGFAFLVGTSRVVLGLHYPSDVLVGALIGVGTASAVLMI